METKENNGNHPDDTANKQLDLLENILEYNFTDRKLLKLALTHRSSTSGDEGTYERLEFLGDAVISLVVADYLYNSNKNYSEGEMTEIKSIVVSRKSLMYVGRRLKLEQFLKVDNGLANSYSVSASLTSDAYEAVVGAIYLDAGFDKAQDFILKTLDPELQSAEKKESLNAGSKSRLQEYVQSVGRKEPQYTISEVVGPAHDRTFKAKVVASDGIQGHGWGKTKKEAEKNAAKEALNIIFSKKNEHNATN